MLTLEATCPRLSQSKFFLFHSLRVFMLRIVAKNACELPAVYKLRRSHMLLWFLNYRTQPRRSGGLALSGLSFLGMGLAGMMVGQRRIGH